MSPWMLQLSSGGSDSAQGRAELGQGAHQEKAEPPGNGHSLPELQECLQTLAGVVGVSVQG